MNDWSRGWRRTLPRHRRIAPLLGAGICMFVAGSLTYAAVGLWRLGDAATGVFLLGCGFVVAYVASVVEASSHQ